MATTKKKNLTRKGLAGLTVALRGTFPGASAKDLAAALRALGAKVADRLTPGVEVLFVGDEPGWLATEARSRGIMVVDEAILRRLLGDDLRGARGARAQREAIRAPRPAQSSSRESPSLDAARAAVWASPSDDEALLVWADALSERGDVRGEFISLSLRVNREVPIAPTPEQEARLKALKKGPKATIYGAAAKWFRTANLDVRGLVTSIACEAAPFIEGFEDLMQLSPLLAVSVTSVRKQKAKTVAALATLPLERVPRLLDLGSNSLDDADLATLAPALAGVRELGLSGNELSGRALEALAPFANELELLSLGRFDTPLDVASGWLETLARPAFAALNTVRLKRSLGGVPHAAIKKLASRKVTVELR